MPTYEYACKFCGHQLEIVQSIKAASLRRCPSCHKLGLRRLISGGAGLIFKGSGFYETDYKRSPTPPKTDKPETASSSDQKAADAKSSPKPEAPKPTPTPVKT
jgi:putative FmdB family regulatory protein